MARQHRPTRHITLSLKWILRVAALVFFVSGILIVYLLFGSASFVSPRGVFAPIAVSLICLLFAEVADDL